jgi:hypothetical protein
MLLGTNRCAHSLNPEQHISSSLPCLLTLPRPVANVSWHSWSWRRRHGRLWITWERRVLYP